MKKDLTVFNRKAKTRVMQDGHASVFVGAVVLCCAVGEMIVAFTMRKHEEESCKQTRRRELQANKKKRAASKQEGCKQEGCKQWTGEK